MAKDNNDISDLVKKCKILLLDIEGTTTSISFVKDKLFPYAEKNVKNFLESHWEEKEVQQVVAALRKLAIEDQEKSVEGSVAIPGEDAIKEEQIDGLVNSVKWQMSTDRKAGPMKELQGLIWKVGYDKGDIQGHVYDDVSPALEMWRSLEGQKVYIYSSGSIKAQKLLFRHSLVGDLLPHIEGHFDTAVGAKREPASYAAIADKIGCKPEDILFLTDIVQEAEAARRAGAQAALISREGNAPLPAGAASFPVLHSLDQLTPTNKRKPHPQVEELPAKVPKTDVLDDVKTAAESESENAPKAKGNSKENGAAGKIEEPEKMEVEETSLTVPETEAINVANKAPVDTNTASIEGEKNSVKDVPMVDAATDPAFVTDMKTVAVNTNGNDSRKETSMKDATTETVDANVPVEIAEENNSGAKVKVAEMKAESAPARSSPMDTLDEKATKAAIKAEDSAKAAAKLKSEENPVAEVVVDSLPEDNKITGAHVVEASPAVVIEPESMEVSSEEAKGADASVADAKTGETSATETNPAVELESVESTVPEVQAVKPVAPETSSLKSEKVAADSQTETEVAKDSASRLKGTNAPPQADTNSDDLSKVTSAADAATVDEEITFTVGSAVTEEKEEMIVETIVEDVTDDGDAVDDPVCETIPVVVVEENIEKTDVNETEKMETEATENVENVMESKKPAETDQGSSSDSQNVPPTIITEVQDITDDKESLGEVTVNDIIDDLVPIVEEPSPMEEIDALQNAGDVLEKECDEILSKVQDVTNLDFIPVKSLHTITEEMETENIDSNDIVEGILDTEMELNLKPCEDIDVNVVQEISETTTQTEVKTDIADTEKPCNVPENVVAEKMEASVAVEKTDNEQKVEPEKKNGQVTAAKQKPDMETEEKEPEPKVETETKVEVEEMISKPQESKNNTEKSVDEPAAKINEFENKQDKNDKTAEVAQDAKAATDDKEAKVNGKSNGDTAVKVNGNSSKDDELTSRLSGDNCKEGVNGANGVSANAEKGQGDDKVETEVSDIKVKAVVTDESRQPIDHPTET